MERMKQYQIWNENEEYQKIIDAIGKIPAEERTPELDSELARAYNNIAEIGDRELFQKALQLLKPHEEYFGDQHNWNFRTAYSYFYLDQAGPALRYFQRALIERPDDEDTLKMMDACRSRLSLPYFEKNFRQRTEEAWAAFEKGEADLRRLMDRKDRSEIAGQLIAFCSRLLSAAFSDVSFELGYNDEKYELILTSESQEKFFELVYFRRHAPASLQKNWNIHVGRQPSRGFELRSGDQTVAAEDVEAYIKIERESVGPCIDLTLYCESLLPLLRDDENKAWWMLSTLTDQVIGEIPAMALIRDFDVADRPQEGDSVRLSDLLEALEKMGLSLDSDPEAFLENSYLAYEMEPDDNPEADWRMDVFAGVCRCPSLLSDYLSDEYSTVEEFCKDGAAAGFFAYPLTFCGAGEDRGAAVLDYRDALEDFILKEAGADAVTFLGGASGIYCGYLDFIAWDLPAVLDAASEFFKEDAAEWAIYHSYRRDAGAVRLFSGEEENDDFKKEGESEAAPDSSCLSDISETSEGQEDEEPSGVFAGFALLSEAAWDKEQLIGDLKQDWNIDAKEERDQSDGKSEAGEQEEDLLFFETEGRMAAVSLIAAPVPDKEAERNAANNYMWPEAVSAAESHKAHLMVAVLGGDRDVIQNGRLFVKIMASCCRQKNITGIYTSGTLFEPRFYRAFADLMKEDPEALPIYNWIWFGLYRGENGVCCYTYGMEAFGKEEMEVLNANAQPSEVRDFTVSLVSYVLEYDVTLQDGETIGFSEEDKHAITRGPGVSLPDTATLKISYEATKE